MTSNPPGQCCTVGVKHEGTAKGEIKKIGDVRTYFTYPEDKSTENAILILTDVIGIDALNVQLIADQIAAHGYFVAMPDLFFGNPVPMNPPAGFDIKSWIATDMPKPDKVDPVIAATIKELRGPLGVKNLGGVGYCFGGKYVCRFLKKGGGLDAGFTAHPSFVSEEELRGVEGGLSVAAAETDEIFPAPKRHETEAILNTLSVPWQINLFSSVVHGFAVRGDPAKPREKFAKEAAFLQAVQWFDVYLKAQGALREKL